MLSKRIIAALDIKVGRTVKGVCFEALRDAGDPVSLAARYSAEGIDEIVLLDISATVEGRSTMTEIVRQVAKVLSIPFTVGGGIRTLEEVREVLEQGADKVFLNSAVLANPALITKLGNLFGKQCIVVAIDARLEHERWVVYSSGGKLRTNRELFEWSQEAADRGAGEILFTSMSHDGTKAGFAAEATGALARTLPIPVIVSGGAGTMQHFKDVFAAGADAALAASVFHFGEIEVRALKRYLKEEGVVVRL